MSLTRLFRVLSDMHPLSEEFKLALEKEMALLSLPKNHVLLEASKISNEAYFLNSGFAMSYMFINGKKRIENFWTAGQIVISPRSFFEQTPATEFIQLMQPSDILHIHYQGVMRLLNSFPEANHLTRIIMNRYFEESQTRIRELQHSTAEDQYQGLSKKYPNIEQILSQDLIASYLGIAPQSLSRLKRHKSQD